VPGADEYHIFRATSETGTKTLLDDTLTTTSFDDTTATAVTFYWYWVQACNEYGCSDYSSPDRGFRSQESVGPVVYSDHTVDDDDLGSSDGDWDSVIECGETIEMPVILVNQGTLTANNVGATLSTSDAYISITDSAETWSDIAGITEVTSTEDFDFTVDPDTPDGHEVTFDLDVTATNGGPWSDSFTVTVSCTGAIFSDVPVEGKEWMQPWIETFYNAGITSGCAINPLRYCPEREVTRAEMSVFILRALNYPSLPHTPPDQSGTFADVPVAGKEWMESWIEEFYDEGITSGCAASPLRYCPEREVTRAEMAVFILRAFDNLPSVP
jgi:hypothetical protein